MQNLMSMLSNGNNMPNPAQILNMVSKMTGKNITPKDLENKFNEAQKSIMVQVSVKYVTTLYGLLDDEDKTNLFTSADAKEDYKIDSIEKLIIKTAPKFVHKVNKDDVCRLYDAIFEKTKSDETKNEAK